jgi:hypothetical protein
LPLKSTGSLFGLSINWREQGGEIMSDEKEVKTEIKVEKIKDAVVKFKEDMGTLTKDLMVDVDTWKFSVESQKEAVKVDVAFSVIIKKKTDKEEE